MSDKFGPQLLPDDEVPASVWYCKSFGPDYEYEAASHSVIMPTGEQSKLPDHMGVHLTGSFDWELVGAVPVDSVAAINALIGVQGSLPSQAQLQTEGQRVSSTFAGPSTARPDIPPNNPGSAIGSPTALSLEEAKFRRDQGDLSCTACLTLPSGPKRCRTPAPHLNRMSGRWESHRTTRGNPICTRCLSTARFSDKRNISDDCDSV